MLVHKRMANLAHVLRIPKRLLSDLFCAPTRRRRRQVKTMYCLWCVLISRTDYSLLDVLAVKKGLMHSFNLRKMFSLDVF